MAELRVRELHPALGAEVTGLPPETPFDEATCRQLKEIFDARSVVVFPGLDIDEAYQRYVVYTLIGDKRKMWCTFASWAFVVNGEVRADEASFDEPYPFVWIK